MTLKSNISKVMRVIKNGFTPFENLGHSLLKTRLKFENWWIFKEITALWTFFFKIPKVPKSGPFQKSTPCFQMKLLAQPFVVTKIAQIVHFSQKQGANSRCNGFFGTPCIYIYIYINIYISSNCPQIWKKFKGHFSVPSHPSTRPTKLGLRPRFA